MITIFLVVCTIYLMFLGTLQTKKQGAFQELAPLLKFFTTCTCTCRKDDVDVDVEKGIDDKESEGAALHDMENMNGILIMRVGILIGSIMSLILKTETISIFFHFHFIKTLTKSK